MVFDILPSDFMKRPEFCLGCLSPYETLFIGECGGNLKVVGCRTCEQALQQTTGGISPTPGGELFTLIPWNSNWDIPTPA